MEYWFFSDYHFDHNKMAKMRYRGYEDGDVEQMNQDIIDSHNKLVKKSDIVYCLGDFCWKNNEERMKNFKNQLNGQIHFILGNHDEPNVVKRVFENVYQYYDKSFNGVHLFMCHYPMLSWNRSHYNSINVHGHHHSNIVFEKFPGKRMNVAWEVCGYRPVSLTELLEFAKDQPDNWDIIKNE